MKEVYEMANSTRSKLKLFRIYLDLNFPIVTPLIGAWLLFCLLFIPILVISPLFLSAGYVQILLYISGILPILYMILAYKKNLDFIDFIAKHEQEKLGK